MHCPEDIAGIANLIYFPIPEIGCILTGLSSHPEDAQSRVARPAQVSCVGRLARIFFGFHAKCRSCVLVKG